MTLAHRKQKFPTENNQLSFLQPSLDEMFRIMDRYVDERTSAYSPDRPYAYNERATLSLWAGGMWRSNPNNVLIEELCGDKPDEDGTYRGRDDIWFNVEGVSCYGEAKQVWPWLSRRAKPYSAKVVETLRVEMDNAHLRKSSDERFGLGIVFSVPCLGSMEASAASSILEKYREGLKEHLQTFHEEAKCVVLWWSFLRPHLLESSFYYDHKGQLVTYPGVDVIVAARES